MLSSTGPTEMFALSPEHPSDIKLTMADRVMAEMHRLIVMGEVPPGSPLPIREFADRFGTSPMPVREALRRLSALGIVDIAPHRGARVSDVSVADLEDTYRIRLVLEPLAISAAATHVTDDQLARATAALERLNAMLDVGDMDGARQSHTEFHFRLYQAAQSRWLLRAIEPVWQNSDRYRFSIPSTRSENKVGRKEHAEILQACRVHDSEQAKEAMERHLTNTLVRIREVMLSRRQ